MDTSMLEYNFDGLIGPTHNYAGLSYGNIASISNKNNLSNPKAAALQGLKKIQLLMDLNIPQAILPPHSRPNIPWLRKLGFCGNIEQILQQAYKTAPYIFNACYSASSMWAANAATVSASSHTLDHKLHLTIANLLSNFHRSQEAMQNYKIFKKIFSDETLYTVHPPLPCTNILSDEGAANHSYICQDYAQPGLELYCYGTQALANNIAPAKFPARQTLEAQQAISRNHQSSNVLFLQQHPSAIDAGVFHNDVIFVANKNVILSHEQALLMPERAYASIQKKVDFNIHFITIRQKNLSVQEAIESYLFNSQLISLQDQTMALIAPLECKTNQAAYNTIQNILSDSNPINTVEFVDCQQSMHNGGGPACLRLRIILNKQQANNLNANVILNKPLMQKLIKWVNKHYRDSLNADDLLDPNLYHENCTALDELTQLLNLGSIYPFQTN